MEVFWEILLFCSWSKSFKIKKPFGFGNNTCLPSDRYKVSIATQYFFEGTILQFKFCNDSKNMIIKYFSLVQWIFIGSFSKFLQRFFFFLLSSFFHLTSCIDLDGNGRDLLEYTLLICYVFLGYILQPIYVSPFHYLCVMTFGSHFLFFLIFYFIVYFLSVF